MSNNAESIALIDSLVQCTIETLKSVSLGTADVVYFWFRDVVIDGNYYTQNLQIINQEFIKEQVPSREARLYELGNYLYQLDPKHPAYQDTVQKVDSAAGQFNCSPYELESAQNDELPENIDW